MRQQLDRCLVGPVHVLQDQQQPVPADVPADQGGDRGEQLEAGRRVAFRGLGYGQPGGVVPATHEPQPGPQRRRTRLADRVAPGDRHAGPPRALGRCVRQPRLANARRARNQH
jgi:hypothetical protein